MCLERGGARPSLFSISKALKLCEEVSNICTQQMIIMPITEETRWDNKHLAAFMTLRKRRAYKREQSKAESSVELKRNIDRDREILNRVNPFAWTFQEQLKQKLWEYFRRSARWWWESASWCLSNFCSLKVFNSTSQTAHYAEDNRICFSS